MDAELRAELLSLRALLLLTLGQVANTQRDPNGFLGECETELVRALSGIRIEPEAMQHEVRVRAVSFARDWFTHIHFKEEGDPPPYQA